MAMLHRASLAWDRVRAKHSQYKSIDITQTPTWKQTAASGYTKEEGERNAIKTNDISADTAIAANM